MNKIEYRVIQKHMRYTCIIYLGLSFGSRGLCNLLSPFPSTSVLAAKHLVYNSWSLFTSYIPVTGGSRDWASRGRESFAGVHGILHG